MPKATDTHTIKLTIKSDRVGEGREKDFGTIEAVYTGLDYETLVLMQDCFVDSIRKGLTAAGLQVAEQLKKGE